MVKTQQQRPRWGQQWVEEYRAGCLSDREWYASNGVKPSGRCTLQRFKTEQEAGPTDWLPVDLTKSGKQRIS